MKHPGKMMRELLSNMLAKPATTQYPAVKLVMPERFRGKILFHAEKCVGCKLCVKDCPTAAIEIRKMADKKYDCIIDCSMCIFCAQCVESCTKKALEATKDFELAGTDRQKMIVTFAADLSTPPPAPAKPAPPAPPAVPTAPAAPKPQA